MPGTRRIAVSGHRGLPAATADLVNKAIRAGLAECAPDVTGISCLADGADQIFARAVTDLGGRLEVIVPAAGYRAGFPAATQPEYDRGHGIPVRVIWPDGAQRE
jgi:hypothetical protein